MLNKVILIGRLTRDPEIRTTTSGISVGLFTLAVNRNYTSANGQREADFISCVSYRKLAETIGQYVRKGQLICVEGRIQTRNYDAQDGTKRYVTEVIVDSFEFLESRSSNENNNSNNNYYQQQQQQPSFNMNQQQQPKYNNNQNYQNNNNNYSQPKDNFFDDNQNIDISEDDLPF